MKPWVKHSVGVLCHLPGLYLLFDMGFFFWMLAQITRAKGSGAHLPLGSLFLIHLLVVLALLAFYFFWLLFGSRFTFERKVLWAVGLTFGAPVMMPVLYWLYIRPLQSGPYFLGRPVEGMPWFERG